MSKCPTYGAPISDRTNVALVTGGDQKDGITANDRFFRDRSNWRTLGFTEEVDGSPAWSFNGIEGRGYPRLRSADGVGLLGEQ